MTERIVGMLIFPRLTQLDMTGPYEVLARLPNTKVLLVAHTMAPVKTDRGMEIVPTVTFADCPQLDVIMVPGGPGQQDLMEDGVVLEFLQRQARNAKYVTSVCTGAMLLAEAGHEVLDVHLTPEGAWLVDGGPVTLVPAGGRTGLDARYLAELGDEAVEPIVDAWQRLPAADRAALAPVLSRRRDELKVDPAIRGWPSWNLTRERARAALARWEGPAGS